MRDGTEAGTKYFQVGVALLTLAPFAYWLTDWAAVLLLMMVGFVLSVSGLWMLVYR